MSPEAFELIHLGHAVFEPVANDEGYDPLGSGSECSDLLEQDPDKFFASVYTVAYEALCGRHQAAADAVVPTSDECRVALEERAYMATWNWSRVPEICALVSDDVGLVYAMLHLSPQPQEAVDRAKVYAAGRLPWGNTGAFPDGRWLVL